MLDMLGELATVSSSWRFWIPTIAGFVTCVFFPGEIAGWIMAIPIVAGLAVGLFWSRADRD